MSPSPIAPFPLEDLPQAVAWISEITGVERGEVQRRLRQEHARLGANVEEAMQRDGVEPYQFSDKLAALYAATDSFLYETYTWNRYPTKQKMRKWIIEFLKAKRGQPLRVLAFGDGLGFDAGGLALAGHDVTYFEVGERSIAFAKRVFEANQIAVTMCSQPENLPHESFDAIMCLDVLEHVPQPAELVKKLVPHLKTGGYFIVHAPFWYLHPNVSTHLKANLKYSGEWKQLYGTAGLTPVSAELAWNPLVLVKNDASQRMPFFPALSFRAGQALLGFSRYWNWPLIAISQTIIRSERRKLLKSSGYLNENK